MIMQSLIPGTQVGARKQEIFPTRQRDPGPDDVRYLRSAGRSWDMT